MTPNYTIIGFTDSVNECDCCGKKELKGTFCIEKEDGTELYYGSMCAKRNLKLTSADFTSKERADKADRVEAAKAEFNASLEKVNLDKALSVPCEFMDDYYVTVVEPLVEKSNALKKQIQIKYKITHF